ncbi:MAG: radical SAM family heme chaperone HemW, partial [Candidatus Gastranaerophilales bacterium]|nr:radical SAM family heme chaperone HemW [Candidatus Gastranaerophilales bacterium]
MIKHAYIHIPFCLRKCKYCSFVSGEDIKNKEVYLDRLFYEIKNRYNKEKLQTLYIGGGTPSLLEGFEVEKIISKFYFEDNPEITIEVNPETVEQNKFIKYRSAGINRVSLGVQSFDSKILELIGRNHTKKDITNALELIKKAGFDNISIDLIYGLPSQTFEKLKFDLENVVLLDIQHISTYGLKIEPESFFGKNPPSNIPDNDIQADMYEYLCNFLKKNNFNHYEISNFSKSRFESGHNTAYWLNKEYYGFGLNASGYEKNIRYKNISKLGKYIENPLEKEEITVLSKQETMENEIFLGLRLKQGINIKDFDLKYSIDFRDKYNKILNKYQNFINIDNGYCHLTESGFLISNVIMSEFI